jgi:hypothetical protein
VSGHTSSHVCRSSLHGKADILAQPAGLRSTKHGDADRLNGEIQPPADTVESVRGITVSAGEIKSTNLYYFLSVQVFEQGHEFIPIDEKAIVVLAQEFAKRRRAGILGNVSPQGRNE